MQVIEDYCDPRDSRIQNQMSLKPEKYVSMSVSTFSWLACPSSEAAQADCGP